MNDILKQMKEDSNWKNRKFNIEMDGILIKNQKELIEESIKILSNKKKENPSEDFTIKISNISSYLVCDVLDLEPTDFNGWECDWWDNYTDNKTNTTFSVYGEAWYANFQISTKDN